MLRQKKEDLLKSRTKIEKQKFEVALQLEKLKDEVKYNRFVHEEVVKKQKLRLSLYKKTKAEIKVSISNYVSECNKNKNKLKEQLESLVDHKY